MSSRISFISLLVLLSLGLALGKSAPPSAPTGRLRVGAAAAELVADDDMIIAGSILPHKSKGQEGKLRAVAVVLEESRSEQKLVLVACDVVVLTRDLLDPVVEEITQKCAIPAAHILINATHTHHAPSTARVHGYGRDEIFCRRVQKAIVQAVQEANANLKETCFSFWLGEESSVGQNSRLLLEDHTIFWTGPHDDALRPTGPFDPELPVLAFRGPDRKLQALLFNHSTHTIGTRQPGVRSPAFYGLAAQELEAELGGTVCFLEGASGSTHNFGQVPIPEAVLRIKNAVRDALDHAEPRPVAGLTAIKRPFPYKFRTFDEAKEDQAVAAYCQKRLPGRAKETIEIFRQQRKELAPHQGEEHSTWLQVLLIGDVAIVGVPGELFTTFGEEIKRRSPFRYTYVAELANDTIGYLPDRKGFELGGYQTWTGWHSLSAPGTGEAIVAAAVAMLHELAGTSKGLLQN